MKQLLALVQPHLREVEEAIADQVRAFDPALQGYVTYALNTTGKRLRPALALLAAGATGGIGRPHVELAVVLELIHLATLVHDDVMDGADTRRGQPTTNARWGNSLSVLLGDCLFAHALGLATEFEDASVARRIARAAQDVCTGEILQTQRRFDLALSFADYYRMIEMKTAALFAAAAELGARLNGTEPTVCTALGRYGLKLGTAYQVYDDCLDLAGDERQAGKTLGTDLQKGKLTLPVLHLLQATPPDRREGLDQLLLHGDPGELLALREAARSSGALAAAVRAGRELVGDARLQLARLEPGPHRRALDAVGEQLSLMIAQFA